MGAISHVTVHTIPVTKVKPPITMVHTTMFESHERLSYSHRLLELISLTMQPVNFGTRSLEVVKAVNRFAN